MSAARKPRDSDSLEELGSYDPLAPKEKKYAIKVERVKHWLAKGAMPAERVAQILKGCGVQ